MRKKDRAGQRYWQTLLFNRAAQIQTQSWPAIGRLWLGLGTGDSNSCLEMMEAPEKGDGEEQDNDNNNPKLLWNSVVQSVLLTAQSDTEWEIRERHKLTSGGG